MDVVQEILESFDIRGLRKKCNFRGCEKPPSKDILLFEVDKRINTKKRLVSLYFCTEHYNTTKSLLEKLNRTCEKGKSIDKEVTEIGFVTH